MRRSRAPSNWPGPFLAARSWAGCTTNMFGFDLRQAEEEEKPPDKVNVLESTTSTSIVSAGRLSDSVATSGSAYLIGKAGFHLFPRGTEGTPLSTHPICGWYHPKSCQSDRLCNE